MHNTKFWRSLEALVQVGEIIIDRPANTGHPHYPATTYPFDYGYVDGTQAGDGEALDVWLCKMDCNEVTGIVVTANTSKKDTEIKVLLGCSEAQAHTIRDFHDAGAQSAMLILRDTTSTKAG